MEYGDFVKNKASETVGEEPRITVEKIFVIEAEDLDIAHKQLDARARALCGEGHGLTVHKLVDFSGLQYAKGL